MANSLRHKPPTFHARILYTISYLVSTMGKDYYQILNLTRSVSNTDVKRAYRKLSLKHHPDRSDDPKSDELFLEVSVILCIIIDCGVLINAFITV